jgi:hypothetical protein
MIIRGVCILRTFVSTLAICNLSNIISRLDLTCARTLYSTEQFTWYGGLAPQILLYNDVVL